MAVKKQKEDYSPEDQLKYDELLSKIIANNQLNNLHNEELAIIEAKYSEEWRSSILRKCFILKANDFIIGYGMVTHFGHDGSVYGTVINDYKSDDSSGGYHPDDEMFEKSPMYTIEVNHRIFDNYIESGEIMALEDFMVVWNAAINAMSAAI